MIELTVVQDDVDLAFMLVRRKILPLSCGCALTLALRRHLGLPDEDHVWTTEDEAAFQVKGKGTAFYSHNGRALVQWFDTNVFSKKDVGVAPVPCVVTFTEQDHL